MKLVQIPGGFGAASPVWVNVDLITAVTGGLWGERAAPDLVGKPLTRIWFGAGEDDYFQFNVPIDEVLTLFAQPAIARSGRP